MEPNIFSPKISLKTEDKLSGFFSSLAQNILVMVLGLLPVFFIPQVYTSLGFTKVYFVVLGIFAALMFVVLAILRRGQFSLTLPPTLAFFWGFTAIAVASATLSGDRLDSLTGGGLEIHTAGFMILLSVVMTMSLLFVGAKKALVKLLGLLTVSAILLQVFHLVRLFFGPEILSFGFLFSANTTSPIGSLNDLAIFSGLVIIVVLILIQQLSRTNLGRLLSAFLVLSSLTLLSVINFYAVWLVVGFCSVLAILYSVTKDTWFKSEIDEVTPVSKFALSLIGIVCLFAAAFVINGDYFGGVANRISGVDYIEVRPSLSATLDITKSVFANDLLLGVGPNLFEDIWRQYKNPVINETLFWNTNFSSGSSYLLTLFITTGLAGGIFFLLFLGSFLYSGYKSIFVTEAADSGWRLMSVISFVAAAYLWLLSVIYVPGTTILVLATLFTGLSLASYLSIRQQKGVTIDVAGNKKHGLLLMTGALVVVVLSVTTLTTVSKQFFANANYANTVNAFNAGTATFEDADAGLLKSQNLHAQDVFVSDRARLRLLEISRLSTEEVTDEARARYNQMLSEGIDLANQAIALDNLNPANYILLTNFLGLLNPEDFEGVIERNEAMFARAMELDPVNPTYYVLLAQHKARVGQLEETRKNLIKAVELKNNYTDALYLLSQLDIEEGNIESALRFTRSIITLEPNNPTRYFQLGLLLAANENAAEAAIAFERAISITEDYANARYFLALAYLDLGRQADALDQLRIVLQSNPDNQLIKDVISQVESGEYVRPENGFGIPVNDAEAVNQDGDIVTTTEVVDTELVTPVNRQGSNNQTATEETETDNDEVISNDTEVTDDGEPTITE